MVITGSTGGIGFYIAQEIARLEARVIFVGRDEARADAAVEKLKQETGNAMTERIVSCTSLTTCVSTAPVDETTGMSFTIPLTGSTIIATAAVVTMCSASTDCTDSATPTCSEDVCVAMSCGGGSFTPDGVYDSLWDSVKPMKGKYIINMSGACAC